MALSRSADVSDSEFESATVGKDAIDEWGILWLGGRLAAACTS
jgi:hypothetical protein